MSPDDIPQTVPKPPPLNKSTKTLAQKLKKDADRTLKRLAPVEYSPKGKPRVIISDSVFQEGADLHKYFIIGRFKGRLPTFRHIQNVLSHMWGRGQRVEVHLNHANNSMLVRLPNEFIRMKVLEKKMWYIGKCMFLVAQWDSSGGANTDMDAIPIWAHLKGMPFDLMHHKGISLVAGLVGEPKEMDEFTRNLVSLSVAHVKVERNLSEPLPSSVEIVRDSGEVITIDVQYPWIPPTCSHCKEIGHNIRFCPSITLSWFETKKSPDVDVNKGKVTKESVNKGKVHVDASPVLPPKIVKQAACSIIPPSDAASVSGTTVSSSEALPPLRSGSSVSASQVIQKINSHFISPKKASKLPTPPPQISSPMECSTSPLAASEIATYNPFDVLAPPSVSIKNSDSSSLSVTTNSSSSNSKIQSECFTEPFANSSLRYDD